ncbi:MAG: M1 family peptidase, partial [Bacteroidota bacterium]
NPIMTNSESVLQFGNNGYGKPATALNVLRETVMGRELFDFAFKEYAQRWKFKHPTPADFFRTMEDASGVDLDWFWRSWFYTNDHVDLNLVEVKNFELDTKNPEIDSKSKRDLAGKRPVDVTYERNLKAIPQTAEEKDAKLVDFYTNFDEFKYNAVDKKDYQTYYEKLSADEKMILDNRSNYYQLKIENVTGMPTPVLIEFTYEDGTKERKDLPVEIWRFDDKMVTKVFVTSKKVTSIALDPQFETADVEIANNYWPSQAVPTRFEMFKERQQTLQENPMQREKKAKELEGGAGKP